MAGDGADAVLRYDPREGDFISVYGGKGPLHRKKEGERSVSKIVLNQPGIRTR